MKTIFFDKWISHFIRYVQACEKKSLKIIITYSKWPQLEHVMIYVMYRARGVRLNLIIPSSHTSHAL